MNGYQKNCGHSSSRDSRSTLFRVRTMIWVASKYGGKNPPVFTNGNVRYVKWQNMGHWSSFGRGGKMLSFHGCRARNKEFPVERRSGSWDHLPEEFGGSSWLDPSTDGVVDSSFYPQVIQLRPRFDPSFDGICSLKIKTSYDQDLKAAILHFLKRLNCIKWCQLSNIVR